MTGRAEIEPVFALQHLANLLAGFSYRFGSETQLHEAIAQVLTQDGRAFRREVRIDDKNRFDFDLAGIIIEVKIKGSLSEALHQVDRYCALDHVRGVLIASSVRWAVVQEPKPIRGKPVRVIHLKRQIL